MIMTNHILARIQDLDFMLNICLFVLWCGISITSGERGPDIILIEEGNESS